MEQSIQVSARFRPLLGDDEHDSGIARWQFDENRNVISFHDQVQGEKTLNFDHVFPPEAKNDHVYDRVAKRVVDRVLDGYNGTVLAYGQTGSGKTYSIMGDLANGEAGILPGAITNLFKGMSENTNRIYLVRMSYLEIYNEKIHDLLQEGKKGSNLKITRDDPVLGVVIDNLREVIVHSPEAIFDLLEEGENHRHYRSTRMNQRSSRSHTIFRLVVESKPKEDEACLDQVSVSCLNMVDLAGSERQSNARTTGVALKEGSNINKSLLALREVISGLTCTRGATFIPYRNSKLTRILKQALGGNAVTSLICTASPSSLHEGESVNTLHFGVVCKKVQNRAMKNEVGADSAVIQQYRKQVQDLKNELEAQRQKAKEAQEQLEIQQKSLDNSELESKAEGSLERKYASKALNWWRKAELGRLKILREETDRNRKKAEELEKKLQYVEMHEINDREMNESQDGISRRFRSSSPLSVVQSQDTAKLVLKFAKKINKKNTSCHDELLVDRDRISKLLEETLEKLALQTEHIEHLQEYCKEVEEYHNNNPQELLPQDRIEAIEKWEADMKAWHEQSVQYNEETDERADMVEREAERLNALRVQLEEQAENLRIREQNVADREVVAQEREINIELLAMDKANEIIQDFNDHIEELEEREALVAAKEDAIPREAARIAQEQIEKSGLPALEKREADLTERLKQLHIAQMQIQLEKEEIERQSADLEWKEVEIEAKLAKNIAAANQATGLQRLARDLRARQKNIDQQQEMCDELAKDLACREEIIFDRETSHNAQHTSEKLRMDLVNSRQATLKALEAKLFQTAKQVAATIGFLQAKCTRIVEGKEPNSILNVSEAKTLLTNVVTPFEWLTQELANASSMQSFLESVEKLPREVMDPQLPSSNQDCPGTLPRDAIGQQSQSSTKDDHPRDGPFLDSLTQTLGDILNVAVPIIAAPNNQLESAELKFQRRLLSRHLSQAKMILLSSLG